MSTVNFVREFTLIMNECKNEYLSPRERMLWIALFQIANDRAKFNPQTQNYEWPTGFFMVSNDDLNTYCGIGKNAIEQLRVSLKERGYIDFIPGSKNSKQKPMYKIHYLSLASESTISASEKNGDKKEAYSSPNEEAISELKESAKNGAKKGDTISKRKYQTEDQKKELDGHTHSYDRQDTTGMREGGYIGLDGTVHPARYDSAWIISEKARKAVAQRIINQIQGRLSPGTDLHACITEHLENGMPPELIEDISLSCNDSSVLVGRMMLYANQLGYTKDAKELARCRSIAKGNEQLAQALFRISIRGHNESQNNDL